MESKEMVRLACEAMEDKKAQDIKIIDIEKVSTLADYFIIASGSNRNQVQAMADSVSEILGRAGVEPKQMEGYQTANWILLDYRETGSCWITEMWLFISLMRKTGCFMTWNVSGETAFW